MLQRYGLSSSSRLSLQVGCAPRLTGKEEGQLRDIKSLAGGHPPKQGEREFATSSADVSTAFRCLPSPRTLGHHRTHASERRDDTFMSQKGKRGPDRNQILPSVTQRVVSRQAQTPAISGITRPRATLPRALPSPQKEDDSCYFSLYALGPSGRGHGPGGRARWESVRGTDQRRVCHCGRMFKEPPLFRSSGWGHQAGEGGPAAAWTVSWLGCRGPQGPGSCHR